MCIDRLGAQPHLYSLVSPVLEREGGGGGSRKPGADDGSSYQVFYILKPITARSNACMGARHLHVGGGGQGNRETL